MHDIQPATNGATRTNFSGKQMELWELVASEVAKNDTKKSREGTVASCPIMIPSPLSGWVWWNVMNSQTGLQLQEL